MAVARLGDPPSALAASAAVLTGHQPQISHQLRSGSEASDILQFGYQSHGGHGADATEASQPSHRNPERFAGGDLIQMLVQALHSCFVLFDRQEIVLEDRAIDLTLEPKSAKPRTMPLGPVATATEDQAAPQEELVVT